MTQAHNNSNLDDELLSAYIDGELTDEERAAVETRLDTDPAAREFVAEMRSLSGSLKSLPRETLTENLRSAVMSQIGTSQVSLPRVELSMARRLMWPALAIAAAIMLMFVEGNERSEIDKVASAHGRAAERRERDLSDNSDAAFEAPAEEPTTLEAAAVSAAPAPTDDNRMLAGKADGPPATAAGTVPGEPLGESVVAARRMTEAMVESDAELEGVVHLTLTDFRSGAERFNRLLISNGVQFVDEQPAPAASGAAPTLERFGAASEGAATLSTRNAAPTGGFGATAIDPPADGSTSASEKEFPAAEPEMVLVEAPPAQIEQILVGCSQDIEAIAGVTVDPTASGMNTARTKQRLSDYQQYSRSAGKLDLGSEYKVSPQQQSAIAVFNSVPKQVEPAVEIAENQQQRGWAARFYANEQLVPADKLNWQYNQYRDQYFSNQVRQRAVAKGESGNAAKKLSKDKALAEELLRVLFLLHPSQEPAKK